MRLYDALEYLDNIENFRDCRVSIYVKYGDGCMTTLQDALDPNSWIGGELEQKGWLDRRVITEPHLDRADRIVFELDPRDDNSYDAEWDGFYTDDEFAELVEATHEWEEDEWLDYYEGDD